MYVHMYKYMHVLVEQKNFGFKTGDLYNKK